MWDRSANRKQVIPKLVSHINNIGQHGGGVIIMAIKDNHDIIEEFRSDNKSYGYIAKELGYKKDSIKSYCQKNGLGGNRAGRTEEEIKKDYIERFKKIATNFEYISGYENHKSFIKIKCKACGNIQERHANSKLEILQCDKCAEVKKKELRKKKLDEQKKWEQERLRLKLISKLIKTIHNHAKNIEREELLHRMCQRCKVEYKATMLSSVHCDSCIEEIKKEQEEQRLQWKDKVIECRECGTEFEMQYLKNFYCSESCMRKTANRINEINRRAALKKNGKIDYSISLAKLRKKEKDTCHICKEKCDISDYEISDEGYFIAGERYPSIDHVIPVSKGGTHTWDNVRLAHRRCNTIKSDKIIYEESSGQLRII